MPIASTSKAKHILSLCDEDPNFAENVQSLLLLWPDQGRYKTRRTTVIAYDDFLNLLSAFPALRDLELVCLPYVEILDVDFATLVSLGALHNLRSLNITNTSDVDSSRSFTSVTRLLSLVPTLRLLHLRNIPLDVPETLDLPIPMFSLTHFSLTLTKMRSLTPPTLSWIFGRTAERRTLKWLTVHLGTAITESEQSLRQMPTHKGFSGIHAPLLEVASSLTYLSLLGMRDGQTDAILSGTTSQLKELELHTDFSHSDTLLSNLSAPSGLERLSFTLLPWMYGGPRLEPTSAESKHYLPYQSRRKRDASSTSMASRGAGGADEARGSVPGTHVTRKTLEGVNSATTVATIATETEDSEEHAPVYHPDLPFSSASFLSELGPGMKLASLKKLTLPENSRFMRRGKWLNNSVLKACRRYGIEVEETPVGAY